MFGIAYFIRWPGSSCSVIEHLDGSGWGRAKRPHTPRSWDPVCDEDRVHAAHRFDSSRL